MTTFLSLYRTPEEALEAMIGFLQDTGSPLTDFHHGSALRNLLETEAVGLSEFSLLLDQFRRDSFLSTATGDALDVKAADYLVQRVAGVPATGTVRITRSSTGTAVTIPAGWGQLVTVPSPGVPPVAYVTTEDAVFTIGLGTVDVAAVAVDVGTAGNIDQAGGASTLLLAQNPVAGFQTDGDFNARGPFTGGADPESDDALRKRIPIEVRGRVLGRPESFLAAALRVPGVSSAQVLLAGDTKPGGGTVAGGSCEVYFEGAASVQAQVDSELANATVANQTVASYVATAVPMTVDLAVYVLPGGDDATLAAQIKDALKQLVLAAGVGEIVRFSKAVQAVHAIPDIQSVTVPFMDFRKTSASDNTCGDVTPGPGAYCTLVDADITIVINDL